MALAAASCGQEPGPQPDGPGHGPAAQGNVIFESDFSSPEGGLFGGEATFESSSEAGSGTGHYTDYGTLSFSAELPEGQTSEAESGANTVGVFAGERELVDIADASIEVHATPVEWETGIAWGIRCRSQDTGSSATQPPQYYEAALQLDDKGLDAALWLITAEEPSSLATTAELPSTITVQEREWNYLRLDCIGNTITLYVDDQKILEATDDTLASGAVDLFTAAFVPKEIPDPIGASATAEFDNLTIREV